MHADLNEHCQGVVPDSGHDIQRGAALHSNSKAPLDSAAQLPQNNGRLLLADEQPVSSPTWGWLPCARPWTPSTCAGSATDTTWA